MVRVRVVRARGLKRGCRIRKGSLVWEVRMQVVVWLLLLRGERGWWDVKLMMEDRVSLRRVVRVRSGGDGGWRIRSGGRGRRIRIVRVLESDL